MSMRRGIASFLFGVCVVVAPFLLLQSDFARADMEEVERLQDEIRDRNDRLSEIEEEIAAYQAELQKVGAEKNTLQSAINTLELERKKIEADIAYTQNRIGATDLEISKLGIEIVDTETVIIRDKEAIKEILRTINRTDEEAFIISLLRYENLAEFWQVIEELEQVRDSMREEVTHLLAEKKKLEEKRTENTEKREELVELKDQYSDQNAVLAHSRASKAELLEETENEEAQYQALLAEKRAAREQIVRELREFESELQFILDPTTIPQAGTTVFNWPLENIIITQYFGGTEFAKRNPHIYGGRAYHPGVDFGAPVGTKIYAPLSGTVRATGNTDAVPGCYSWGKWTLIDHANGLATLYAHQSVISVSPGQSVQTGDIIGYIGNTGYSTGPHLHFTVYAKDGVDIRKFNEIKAITSCGAARTPVAAIEAYLDPMNYLPPY